MLFNNKTSVLLLSFPFFPRLDIESKEEGWACFVLCFFAQEIQVAVLFAIGKAV